MEIDFNGLATRVAYKWMASTITPRPVAWVSSLSAAGVANLAPFSFFQMITAAPPTLMISPLIQSDGAAKDTADNIRQTQEFVVSLVSYEQVDEMNQTSVSYAREVSEFERCGVEAAPSRRIKAPRVANAPVSFECRLAKLMPYPEHAPSCFVIFGEVVFAHIDEHVLNSAGYIDPGRLNLVSRMGGDWYGRTASASNFELQRPIGWDQRPAAPNPPERS